jgi:alpha-glucosidase
MKSVLENHRLNPDHHKKIMLNQSTFLCRCAGASVLALCVCLVAGNKGRAAEAVTLKSPDGNVKMVVQAGGRLTYTVKFHGNVVIQPSALGVTVDGQDLGQNAVLAGPLVTAKINEHYVTLGVHTNAVNNYRSAVIPFTGGPNGPAWQLEVRAYNDGVAYRYRVQETGVHHINGESSEWQLPVGTTIWHQSADNRSYEARYVPDIVGQMGTGQRLMAPAALQFPGDAGYGLMTEANLIHYSDMALYSSGPAGFKAVFHDDPDGWDNAGEIISPWRVTLLASDLNALVNSDLIRNLCPPPAPELAQATWIKPGRSIWHWLTGGSPKLPKQHAWVDGARDMGYEYYLVDDGWRDWNGGGENAWDALADLVKYANHEGVNVWAWVNAKYVFKPADRKEYFAHAQRIGLVGLKVDFPHPANAEWVQWYDDVLRDAAADHLMIDFHGAVKPTGRERTWPNELSREAVAGREQGKNPSLHDTTLPFLRYVQGHADYTPTLLIPKRLNGSSYAHELAMAIVFTSPFLCLGDNPTNYLQSAAADILKALPPAWDETRVLPDSKIGRLAAFARRNGDQWFIGVINDTMPRRETVSLNFLGQGDYKLVELADNPERDDAFVRTERTVTRKSYLTLPLRPDGGYVAWLVPVAGK